MTAVYKQNLDEASAMVENLETDKLRLTQEHASTIQLLKETVAAAALRASAAMEEKTTAWTVREQKLLQKIEQQHKEQQHQQSNAVALIDQEAYANNTNAMDAFGTVGVTEMYGRVMVMEKELHIERAKRIETELYMKQVLHDLESKAPIIASQRRDFNRIVEAHAAVTAKLDDAIAENSTLKSSIKGLKTRTRSAEEETQTFQQANTDLSNQLQHILKQQMGHAGGERSSGLDPEGVISDYLVRYNDVEELQTRNQQLIQVVRKLSKEQEDRPANLVEDDPEPSHANIATGGAGARGNEAAKIAALSQAMKELQEMKESRKRTQDMINILVTQRDMYREMTEQIKDGSSIHAGSTSSGQNPDQASITHNLEEKLQQAEDRSKTAEERVTRLEDAEKLTNEVLDRTRSEATACKMEITQVKSEARFQKERADRFEGSLTVAGQENTSALQRRMELERIMLSLQRDVAERDNRISSITTQLRSQQDSNRSVEIDFEVLKQSEARYVSQISDAREEVKRHAALAENIQRIENGLKSRAAGEMEITLHETEALKTANNTLREQLEGRRLDEDQRRKSLEDDLRANRSKLELQTMEFIALKEDLAREQVTSKAAQDRAAILEKQLDITQERLTAAHGAHILSSVVSDEGAAIALALEKAKVENKSLRQQLESAETHTDQLRKLSTATETTLTELRTKSTENRAALEGRLQEAETRLSTTAAELIELKKTGSTAALEVEEAREEMRLAKIAAAESLKATKDELLLVKQEADTDKAHLEVIKVEITQHQNAAKQAYDNYERELQLHAQAESKLKSTGNMVQELKGKVAAAEQVEATRSADAIRKERLVHEAKAQTVEDMKGLEAKIADLQCTNELLHGQVQSYGAQVESLQAQMFSKAVAAGAKEGVGGGGEGEGETSTLAPSDAVESSENIGGFGTETGGEGELNILRKSTTEMREVPLYRMCVCE